MSEHTRKARNILDQAAAEHLDREKEPVMYALFLALMEIARAMDELEQKIDRAP